MWLRIKHVSQLLVISFGFWGGVTGQLNPTLAFLGILAAYVGVEQLESLLVSIGENAAGVRIEDGGTGDQEDEPRPDGGRIRQYLLRERDDDGS